MKPPRSTSMFLALGALIAATVPAACVNGTLPRRSANHPGSPAAPEGYDAAELTAIAEDARHDHGSPRAEATTYTCPMHPEVVAGTPGNCPKCGMKLVPKPSPPKSSPSASP